MKTKIAVLGGAGYIGSVMVKYILNSFYREEVEVIVYDRFFFGNHFKPRNNLHCIKADTRRLDVKDFDGISTVIDLAGISNDPACDLDQEITHSVNYDGCVNAAWAAKQAGVYKYLYASSCSVYGESDQEEVNENSELRPVSLYAETKIKCEETLLDMNDDDFNVIRLRNATAFGVSPRMRFDLVVNLMTLYAYKNHKIYIMGGGKQWRPLVSLYDISRVFGYFAFKSPFDHGGECFNVGSTQNNYRVEDIAKLVKRAIPQTELIYVPDDNDKRSYKVNCDKLKDVYNESMFDTPSNGIANILESLQTGTIKETPQTNTVNYYKYLLDADKTLKEVYIEGRIF